MRTQTLDNLSDQLADVVTAAASSVVQVHGRRQPASGIVFDTDTVITTARALGREDRVTVRTGDGRPIDADVIGWDPATHLAVLRVEGLAAPAATPATRPARVGHLVLAIGRSWSNSVTATLGNVAIIGGPLRTGPDRTISEIIRTTAPMHAGFTGGALVDTEGHVVGVATAADIRGLRVVIPATITWTVAREILEHGQVRRGYLGLAGHAVRLAPAQRGPDGPQAGVLVLAVTAGSPAEAAGLLVGDIITALDGVAIDSTDALVEALTGDRVGRQVSMGVVRGGRAAEVSATVGSRPVRFG